MADPVQFDGQNFDFKKPNSMTDDECGSLPCYVANGKHGPTVMSRWKLTPQELYEINKTGTVWVITFGIPPQPVCILGEYPFVREGSSDA